MSPQATTSAEIPECTARFHGTREAVYRQNCVCPGARRVAHRYDKLQKMGRLPKYLVDGTGTRRRLQAYALNGWTVEQIGNAIGCARNNVVKLCRTEQVTAEIAQAVRAVEWMATVPPPAGRSATYARKHAAKAGWWPLDAWFNPDTDPEPPTVDETSVMHAVAGDLRWDQLGEQEQHLAVAELTGRGWSDTRIAELLRTSHSRVARARNQLGIASVPASARRTA